jgi:hypothetical protein
MILKKYFRRKIWRKYWRFLLKLLIVICKNLIITLVFEKNAIFRRKLAKIAENCDHNIERRNGIEILQIVVAARLVRALVVRAHQLLRR